MIHNEKSDKQIFVEVDEKRIKLQIWDAAGQERMKTISESYYRAANGIFLVYDIASTKSFENCESYIRNIRENAPENVEILLVGNKVPYRGRLDTLK